MLLTAVVIFTSVKIGISNDAKRFDEADNIKTAVATQLANSLDDKVVSSSEKEECFNTGQGPYDNGNLWCQTSTVIKLNENINFKELTDKFIGAATSSQQKPVTSGSGEAARSWFTTSKGLSCSLSSMDSSGHEQGSSTRLPFDDTLPAVAISCSDEANAKHYTYVE